MLAHSLSVKLLGQATTLPGKKIVSDAVGVVIERVQGEVRLGKQIPGRLSFSILSSPDPAFPAYSCAISSGVVSVRFAQASLSELTYSGHGASGLEGEWLFKASLVDLTTKIVTVRLLQAICRVIRDP
jgi:hypothetical protein